MSHSKFVLFFLVLIALQFFRPMASAQDDLFTYDPNLERCREATVRILANGAVGSGCVFREDSSSYYVLTNGHVAGTRKGDPVTMQFWWRGYLSNPVKGVVTEGVKDANRYRDIAVVRVDKADLKGYKVPVIPLALEGSSVSFERLYSFGCAAGSWLTNFEGHAVGQSSNSGDVIHFVLMPAGGRSGSPIFDYKGERIIALVAWRSESKNHSQDGRTETDGYGIAMTYREIQDWMKGRVSYGSLPVDIEPLTLEKGEAIQNVTVPQDAPIVFRENQPDINYCLLKDEIAIKDANPSAYVLRYEVPDDIAQELGGDVSLSIDGNPPFLRDGDQDGNAFNNNRNGDNDKGGGLFNNIDPNRGKKPEKKPDLKEPDQKKEELKKPDEKAPQPEEESPLNEEDNKSLSPFAWLLIANISFVLLIFLFSLRRFLWNLLFYVLAKTNESRLKELACSDD